MPSAGLQTVVFVGPSCPHDLIRAVLPDSVVAPPVRRGDLYRLRLLDFSVFVILDGVFTNLLAVSPREVVDVLQDGAAVIGASSMGALRAVDCGPAGAAGHGRVYRMFRRRLLTSEDEVAVMFLPEAPYPALSQSLVNIRFALRRACRSGLLDRTEAEAMAQAAEFLPYERRDWTTVAVSARVRLSQSQFASLKSCDVKREDALACCRWAARQLRVGAIVAAPRQDRSRPFETISKDRERTWDPLDGVDPGTILPAFFEWLWLSGQSDAIADAGGLSAALRHGHISEFVQNVDLRAPSAELGALLMRFTAFSRSRLLAEELHLSGSPRDFARARVEIACAHNAHGWEDLIDRTGPRSALARKLRGYKRDRARIFALTRSVLFRHPASGNATLPVWQRSRKVRQPAEGH